MCEDECMESIVYKLSHKMAATSAALEKNFALENLSPHEIDELINIYKQNIEHNVHLCKFLTLISIGKSNLCLKTQLTKQPMSSKS